MAKVHDAIYHDEAVFTTLLSNRNLLNIFDVLTLVSLNSKLATHPVDVSGELHAFWDVLLTYRWDEFLRTNALARLKKAYTWNNGTIQTIVAKLRRMVQENDAKHGVTMLPLFYIPDNFYFGDEELLYVYTILALYQQAYYLIEANGSTTEQIDLYGQGLGVFRANVPYVQLEIQTNADKIVFVTERTRESETKTEVPTIASRYAIAAQLYRYMQGGPFAIHYRLPYVHTWDGKQIRASVDVDNRLASRAFTFTYKSQPHEIQIRRKI